jgi:uncharacterized protein involved in exopolysaccharide biosynthesis
MKPTQQVQFKTDSFSFLNLIIRYWKVLLIGGIGTFIISAAISLTITPLFRSTVVLYPTTNVVETQTLFGIQGDATPLFGDESATEKVLQILRSDQIRDYLVSRYDLMNHYGIDRDTRYKYTLLAGKMAKYIVSRKTQYNSIEISVLDTDPVTAATMANDIAVQVDTVFNQIVQEAGKKALAAISNSYSEQYARVKELEDSLYMNGVTATPTVNISLRAGSGNSSWATSFNKADPEFLRIMNMFESENENLSDIRSKLTEAKMLAEQDLPYIHIINKARVSEKKALPRRSYIVIASTFTALLLMIFVLALSEVIVRDEEQP